GGDQFSLVRAHHFGKLFFRDLPPLELQLEILPFRTVHTALFHIATVLDRGDGGRIGGGPTDAEFLQFLDQGGLGKAVGGLGKSLGGRYVLVLHGPSHIHGRQHPFLFVG